MDNGLCYLCTRALNGEQAEMTELIQFMFSQVQMRRQHCCGPCETDDVECDEQRPQCSHCVRSGSKCVYEDPATSQDIARLHRERSYLPEDLYMPTQIPDIDTIKAEKSHAVEVIDEGTATLTNTGMKLADDCEGMPSIVPTQDSEEIDRVLRLGPEGQLTGIASVQDPIKPTAWNNDQVIDPNSFEWATTEAFERMAISNSTTEDTAAAGPDWSSLFGLDFIAEHGAISNGLERDHTQNTGGDPLETAVASYQERIEAMDAYSNYLFGQMDVDGASIHVNFEADTRDDDEIAASAIAAGDELIEALEVEMKKFLTGNECPW